MRDYGHLPIVRRTPMTQTKAKQFVTSSDIPLWMCERVATVTHRRVCQDGDKIVHIPRGTAHNSHRYVDILNARLHITDVCNALTITPEDLARLWRYHNPGVRP
jgi:hypothetical protein